MKNLKKKRRVQIVSIAFIALAVATILIGFAMKDGINFFKSPTQVIEVSPNPNEVFRIGG
ncbi:MAG: cytochrome c maturation protein CcmE, partial [Paracoccaceae bacterium]|nr:cytochrome c maturation protein CcmE [Paracoccaceae bacterium]